MGTNANAVFIGRADQSATTGALGRGAVIPSTSIPADIDAALTAISAFTTSGYFSEDGVTLSTTKNVTAIREWNKNSVRHVLEDFDGTLSGTLIQMDEESAKQCFGDDNVTKVAATTTHGTQLKIAIGASLPEEQAWALRMKDGDRRMLVLIPNGMVTSGIDMTFSASSAVPMPITISCNDDGSGKSIYIFTDDGVVSA